MTRSLTPGPPGLAGPSRSGLRVGSPPGRSNFKLKLLNTPQVEYGSPHIPHTPTKSLSGAPRRLIRVGLSSEAKGSCLSWGPLKVRFVYYTDTSRRAP